MTIPRITEIMENEINGIVSKCQFDRGADQTPYSSNDVVGVAITATNLTFSLGTTASAMINGASIIMSDSVVPTSQSGFKLHLFNAPPTAIADNAAFNLIAADRTKYIGSIALDVPVDLGDTIYSQNYSSYIICKSTSSILYGALTTDSIYTPNTSTTIVVTVRGVQC
jgi:hypothetical protein